MKLHSICTVTCPSCDSTIRVYAEPQEKIDPRKQVKCPECKFGLNESITDAVQREQNPSIP